MPPTEAALMTEPASRSDWVALRVPVHVVVTPGSRDVEAHETDDTIGSVTVNAEIVTLPVLRTENE